MDLQTILSEMNSWPVADRLRLVEGIWASLADEGYEPALTEEIKAELDRRVAEMDRNPNAGVRWEVARARVLGGFRNESPPIEPQDEWERGLLEVATDCGITLPDSAVGSEGLYE
jgi:putative addiction module component (TIGR02574 family)